MMRIVSLLLIFFVYTPDSGELHAQQEKPEKLEDFLSYSFPSNLISSPSGNRIAWVFNRKGWK